MSEELLAVCATAVLSCLIVLGILAFLYLALWAIPAYFYFIFGT